MTRLRRRIAEQAIYSKYIDIIFVEHFDSGSSYTSITVTPNGRFEGDLPPGFCDSQDEDFRAIIKARKMRYVVAIDPPMLLDSSICVGCIDDIFLLNTANRLF